MSGRIEAALCEARKNGGGFIPFITAGDPDSATTVKIMLRLAEVGATVIELGVPFSDPMADGPVIQRSSQRVLERGGGDIAEILETVRKVRHSSNVPIVLFGYLNPFLAYGIDRLARDASEAGVDGLLVTDIIDGEFASLSSKLAESGLDLVSLVAPTTSDERLAAIAASARGFIYAVSRTGVTGMGAEFHDSARSIVERVRKMTSLPVAVGFGINTREDVIAVQDFADAAVVGSALVSVMECEGLDGDPVRAVETLARDLLGC